MRRAVGKIISRIVRPLGVPVIDLSPNLAGDAKWHQDFIIHLASVIKPAVYVELGIYKCGLFNRMTQFAEIAIGVDADPKAGDQMIGAPNARFVASTSEEFVCQLENDPVNIDLLFIDADHSQQAVEADFCGMLPFVRPHGLILLHDTHPIDDAATAQERCGDGYLAIERLSRERDDFEMMTIPVHPGLTCCRKRFRQLSWMEPRVACKAGGTDLDQ